MKAEDGTASSVGNSETRRAMVDVTGGKSSAMRASGNREVWQRGEVVVSAGMLQRRGRRGSIMSMSAKTEIVALCALRRQHHATSR